jgi:hypothetical protein
MARIALLACALLLSVPEAIACSCMPWPPPLEALDEATAVFTGRIVEATPTDVERGFDYKIEVHQVWKGVSSEHVFVNTDDVAMCGLYMEVGKNYLVYAYGEPGDLWSHNCSRSREVDFAAEDIAALGDPISVASVVSTLTVLKTRYE